MGDVDEAVAAIEAGELVVYPTETVYGLGADATDPAAIEAVFDLKGRDRDDPLSTAVPSLSAVGRVARPTDRTRAFMETFLPGPVTVVCPRAADLPAVLTGGRERVGVRIPDHELARRLLELTPPLTATSANPSGDSDVRAVEQLAPSLRDGVATVLDGGRTNGTASTVVDVDAGRVYRHGALSDAVTDWLDEHLG